MSTHLELIALARCPLCHHAPIVRRRVGPRGRWAIAPCAACSAEFVATARGLELVSCDPALVARVRGLGTPIACRHCLPCPVGRCQTTAEWRRLGELIHPEPSRSLEPLPISPTAETGEAVVARVTPVYRGEQAWCLAGSPGTLTITRHQLVFEDSDGQTVIPLPAIVDVHVAWPGVSIQLAGEHEPLILYFPPGVPITRITRMLRSGHPPSPDQPPEQTGS